MTALRRRRTQLFDIRRFPASHPLQRRVDVPQQASEHTSRAHFNRPVDSLGRQIADGSLPQHRVRNLLVQSLPGLVAVFNLPRLPIVYQWMSEVAEQGSVEVGFQ